MLITGANQGIGLEFAKEYAARGWTVIATHRRTTTPEELAKLAAKYPKVRIERMDVTDPAQIAALGAKLKGVPIDMLLNNAGLVRTDPLNKPGGNTNQMFGTLDYKLLDDFIHTNVAGPLMITETFIGNVKASHQKKIIAISSAAGSGLGAAVHAQWLTGTGSLLVPHQQGRTEQRHAPAERAVQGRRRDGGDVSSWRRAGGELRR